MRNRARDYVTIAGQNIKGQLALASAPQDQPVLRHVSQDHSSVSPNFTFHALNRTPIAGGPPFLDRFLMASFDESLGVNWGYPNVHGIGNLGKYG